MRCLRPCSLVATLLALVIAGCGDQEPPQAYNRDLSDGGTTPLLPLTVSFHRARDANITAGNQRATLVKLDEFDPATMGMNTAPAGGAGQANVPDLSNAHGAADAMGKVGEAFLGNLLGSGTSNSAGGSTSNAAGGNAGGASTGAAVTGGAVADADATAIRALIERFNTARTQRKYDDLATLSTEAMRPTAKSYYALIAELSTSFGVLSNSFDKIQPGTKAKFAAQATEAAHPIALTQLAAADADTVTASTESSGTVTFRREAGAWTIVDPFVPSADDWSKVESSLTETIDKLDNYDDSLAQGETVSATDIEQALSRAVDLLGGKSVD